MEGNLVKLKAIEEEDYRLFAEWIAPSTTSSLARGANDFVNSKEIKVDIEAGNTRYAVVLTHDNKKIGFVSWQPQNYEGSYLLGGVVGVPELWDSGYGAEGGILIMDYLFHQKNARKIQFINGLHNSRTIRFLIKNKVFIEGILRDHFFVDGEYYDAVISSVLREEYYEHSEPGVLDSIPNSEKKEIKQELYGYLNSYWKDEYLSHFFERK